MKKIFKYVMVAALFTGLASCEDEQDLMFVTPEGSFSIVSPESGSSVILTPETVNNIALTVTWQDMDYTTPTEVNYVVQVASDAEFTTPVDASAVTTTTATLTGTALNTIAINAGIAPDIQGLLYVRVKSSVGTQGAMEMYSNVITVAVTPFQAFTPLKDLFLVGSATATGWDNTATTNMYALYRDPANEDIYYYTGYFAAGEFKMVEVKGQWAPQYGTDGTNLVPRPTEAEPDPASFAVATAGYYSLMVNLSDNTYTFAAYDNSAAPVYTAMGIIGTATPGLWDSDTDMTQSTSNPHIWFITGQALTDGELKFREGDAWTNSWGNTTAISGQGHNANDGNIPVTAGTYDIWFNDLDGRYILIPAN